MIIILKGGAIAGISATAQSFEVSGLMTKFYRGKYK